MTPYKFRQGVAEITKKGIADGRSQADIMATIDSFQGLAGYTDQELNPKLIRGDEIKNEQYGGEIPFSALKSKKQKKTKKRSKSPMKKKKKKSISPARAHRKKQKKTKKIEYLGEITDDMIEVEVESVKINKKNC